MRNLPPSVRQKIAIMLKEKKREGAGGLPQQMQTPPSLSPPSMIAPQANPMMPAIAPLGKFAGIKNKLKGLL